MPQIDFGYLLLIALGLSADCFAVSLGIGASSNRVSIPALLRVGTSFSLFQGLMPVIGWFLGKSVLSVLSSITGWIAFVLLAIIGGRMLWEGISNTGQAKKPGDYTRGLLLVGLAVATSIDAMAAGLSFALIEVPLLSACLVIGATAFIASVTGYVLGNRSSQLLGRWAEILGGILLVGIGVHMMISSL
ncbi:MAG: manganese efflux pump MntP family protein [Dehalococcoidales bacterium]